MREGRVTKLALLSEDDLERLLKRAVREALAELESDEPRTEVTEADLAKARRFLRSRGRGG